MSTIHNNPDEVVQEQNIALEHIERQEQPLDNAAVNNDAQQQSVRNDYEAVKKFTDENSDDISLRSILGGDFLKSKLMLKMVLFFVFVVALCLAYTSNRYASQQETLLIDSLRNKLQDVKYNVLTQSSELMNMTRQTNVETALSKTKDSILHNAVTPPYLIRKNEDYPISSKRQVREVLVDSTNKEKPNGH